MSNRAVQKLDSEFFKIINGLNGATLEVARSAAEKVLETSKEFLTDKAHKAVKDFQELYAQNSVIDASKEEVNKEVDDLIEQIQDKINAGESTDMANLKSVVDEDEEKKALRLRISGVQRELETIIRLDEGIKAKLVPVLSSMQFEDMLRHRLNHIGTIWQLVLDQLESATFDADLLKETLGCLITSNEEKELFYRTILKQELPESEKTVDGWLDFSA